MSKLINDTAQHYIATEADRFPADALTKDGSSATRESATITRNQDIGRVGDPAATDSSGDKTGISLWKGILNKIPAVSTIETLLTAIRDRLPPTLVSNKLPVDVAFPSSQNVSVTNFPATQPISGNVGVNNFPTEFGLTGPVSISNFPATQPISGSVGVTNFPSSFSVSNFPATQPISGNVGVTNFPASFSVSNFPSSFSVSNFPATQPVSLATQPLPTGASTEATLLSLLNSMTLATPSPPLVLPFVIPLGASRSNYLELKGRSWLVICPSMSGTNIKIRVKTNNADADSAGNLLRDDLVNPHEFTVSNVVYPYSAQSTAFLVSCVGSFIAFESYSDAVTLAPQAAEVTIIVKAVV